jgi:hypothetical protein
MAEKGLVQPAELTDMTATHLAPRSRSTKNTNIVRIWDSIFKTDIWTRQVLAIQNTCGKGPIPCLVGKDLENVYDGKCKDANLALLVNDWTGDVKYTKDLLFESLRDHDYDQDRSTVRLKRSGIFLHIGDAITSQEWIPVDPSKLFHRNLTHAIYYTEDILHQIGPSQIGGVEGSPIQKDVRDICSVKLKFSDGSPVYRVFLSPNKAVKVVNIQVRDENGRNWVARWRIAKPHEREWWP